MVNNMSNNFTLKETIKNKWTGKKKSPAAAIIISKSVEAPATALAIKKIDTLVSY